MRIVDDSEDSGLGAIAGFKRAGVSCQTVRRVSDRVLTSRSDHPSLSFRDTAWGKQISSGGSLGDQGPTLGLTQRCSGEKTVSQTGLFDSSGCSRAEVL